MGFFGWLGGIVDSYFSGDQSNSSNPTYKELWAIISEDATSNNFQKVIDDVNNYYNANSNMSNDYSTMQEEGNINQKLLISLNLIGNSVTGDFPEIKDTIKINENDSVSIATLRTQTSLEDLAKLLKIKIVGTGQDAYGKLLYEFYYILQKYNSVNFNNISSSMMGWNSLAAAIIKALTLKNNDNLNFIICCSIIYKLKTQNYDGIEPMQTLLSISIDNINGADLAANILQPVKNVCTITSEDPSTVFKIILPLVASYNNIPDSTYAKYASDYFNTIYNTSL